MAHGNYIDGIMGQFTVNGMGTYFEYAACTNTWGVAHGFMHEIFMCDGTTRCANVKKTIAQVCVDENEFGLPVIQKWAIKSRLWGAICK